MLFKAHRCTSGADLYNPAAHILKTLARDSKTMRVRDLKPGDEESIYNEIHYEGTQFFYESVETTDRCVVKVNTDAKKIPKNLFYTKADALEDEVLFPEEYSSDRDIAKFEPLRAWELEGFSL